METCSALPVLCAGNSPVTGEFPTQRPVTRSFDVFFDLRLNNRLSKQSWGWWFETPSRSLWRHGNADITAYCLQKYTMVNVKNIPTKINIISSYRASGLLKLNHFNLDQTTTSIPWPGVNDMDLASSHRTQNSASIVSQALRHCEAWSVLFKTRFETFFSVLFKVVLAWFRARRNGVTIFPCICKLKACVWPSSYQHKHDGDTMLVRVK